MPDHPRYQPGDVLPAWRTMLYDYIRRRSVARLAITVGFAFFVVFIFSHTIFVRGPAWRNALRERPDTPKRRAVILASYQAQDVQWMRDLSPGWEIYRYMMDDPNARYAVPRNQGREAMAYITFLIDHYDNLPDHMVFIHGHDRAWHSVEPMAWKLDSLNATALDEDDFFSLRCAQEPTANPNHPIDLTKPVSQLGPMERLLPWFWQLVELSPTVPTQIAFPCCAQFAASKAAAQSRSRDWWIKFRAPLLADTDSWKNPEIGDYFSQYGGGLLYEKVWHVAFGKPALFAPDEDHCYRHQWSDDVHCSMYLTSPFDGPPRDLMPMVVCRRNQEPRTADFVYRIYSACNSSTYRPDMRLPEWYSSDPIDWNNPRRHPCPG